LFKILRVVLRPPLDAEPRCHADSAADECDCDKSGFEFGSHCAAVPYKLNLGSVRILSLFNLKFSKKVAAVGLYVAAQPQPTRLFVRLLFSPLRTKSVRRKCESNEICGLQMRQQIKIARTVFSLIAMACSIVVVSWRGLALLGF
jgi:hypothetical protein